MDPVSLKQQSDEMPDNFTLGECLRLAREHKQLSQEDVAKHLHLRLSIIKSLEEDRFDLGVPAIFVKGYIKNFATMVGIPKDILTHKLNALKIEPQQGTHSKAQSFDLDNERQGSRKLVYFTLILVGGFIWAWWQYNGNADFMITDTSLHDASPAYEEATDELVNPLVMAQEDSQGLLMMRPAPSETTASEEASDIVEILAEDTEVEVVGAQGLSQFPLDAEGFATLKFVLKDKTWLKVNDSRGKALALGSKPAGKDLILKGKPPFDIVIGNANSAKIYWGSTLIDLEPHSKGNVARMKLTGEL